MEVKFDPRDFIHKPFKMCPNCKQNLFGINGISGRGYSRRCKSCLYPNLSKNEPRYYKELPQLDKKIVYVDQFILSNILKSLDPSIRPGKQQDPFWIELYSLLDILSKKQLIVCPDSPIQEDESSVVPYFVGLKRIYEQLSHGVSFHFSIEIKRIQIYQYFKAWKNNENLDSIKLDINKVIYGTINEWLDWFYITVEKEYDPEWAEKLLQEKDYVYEEMNSVIEIWKNDKEKTEDDFYNFEIEEERSLIISRFIADAQKPMEQRAVEMMQNKFPSNEYLIVRNLIEVLVKEGIPTQDAFIKVKQFVNSEYFLRVPCINIFARVFAKIAYKYSKGALVKPLRKGDLHDVQAISYFSPYCDFFFTDRFMVSLLSEKSLKEIFKDMKVQFYGLGTRDQFVADLKELEQSMGLLMKKAISDVYGDELKPNLSLFKMKNETHD